MIKSLAKHMKLKHQILGPKMKKSPNNDIYIINEIRPGCFRAEKTGQPDEPQPEHPDQEAQPEPEPRGIWFTYLSIVCASIV